MTKRHLHGWHRDRPDHRDVKLALHRPEKAAPALPTVATLRPITPAIYDQGNEGSCTAHAGGFGWHLEEQKVEMKAVERPSPAWIYYQTRAAMGTVNQDSGASIRNTFKAVARYGYCHERYCPYQPGKYKVKPAAMAYKDAAHYIPTAKMYAAVPQDAATMKQVLSQSLQPIVFGFSVPASLMTDAVAKSGVMPMPASGEKVVGGHAVALIGYDDNRQAFEVRNSWGASWGDAGHFWMPYAFLLDPNWASDFWTVVSAPTGY